MTDSFERLWAERDALKAEIEMLRGVGCREAKDGEPESGPCGVCLKCAEERGAAHAKVEAERDEARAEVERLREALRAIAAGFDTITGSADDPSARQVDGYFRGYAQAALEKGTP